MSKTEIACRLARSTEYELEALAAALDAFARLPAALQHEVEKLMERFERPHPRHGR